MDDQYKKHRVYHYLNPYLNNLGPRTQMKAILRTGNWLNYLLLLVSFIVIGWSAFLLYDSIYMDSHSVEFEDIEKSTPQREQSISETDKLPSRSSTVSIIENNDFGLAPEQKEKHVSPPTSPCAAEDYVSKVLHIHPKQGVHVQFQDGNTKYLLLERFYDLPSAAGRTASTSNFSEIGFAGVSENGIEFQFRTASGNATSSTCKDRYPLDDPVEEVKGKNSSADTAGNKN
jgi:hypothetical protein